MREPVLRPGKPSFCERGTGSRGFPKEKEEDQ